jgi:hypothetical protein
MPDDSSGFFSNLRSYANEYIETKRRNLQAKPQTQVEGGGSGYSVSFSGQDISQSDLRDVKQIRESGGIISQVFHSKALIKFGTGTEIQAEEDDLEAWLQENVGPIDDLALDLGEDSLWYPYGLAETVETRRGEFSHIECIEPWTMLPRTDEFGDITRWEQHLKGDFANPPTFDPEEIGSIIINKSSGRDKTGISEALRSQEEIETFRANQQAMREATERIGYPFVHAKAGREGATQLNDNELRRIRNRLADIGPGETQVTGPDVDIDLKDPATVDFGEIQERDMRMLATSLGVPVELLNHGSDGLGSGMPAELRKDLLALQNEADRRRFSEQFVEDILRPIVRDYSPFDHTQDMEVVFDPFLDDKTDMASLIQSVGDYMTANEARDRLGLSKLDDEEKGESFRTPEDIESPDDQPDGGLFGSAAEQAVDEELSNRDLQDIEDIDTVPSEGAQEQAQMALDWKEETGNPNDCGTQTGWERANQLVNGESLSEDTINRMVSFFARHESTQEPDEPKEDCSRMMWKAWGGDAGRSWAESKQEEFANARDMSMVDYQKDVYLSDMFSREAGGTDFRHSVETDGWEAWEHTLFELQHGIAHGDSDRHLTELTESQVPDFVKDRIRDAIFSDTLFSQFDTIADNDIMQLRNFMEEQLTKDGWTTDGIAGRLQDLEPELTDSEAERIARTETQALVNDAREEGYRETGMVEDETFYWTGAVDNRTTDACKWLMGGSDLADDIGGAFDGTNPNHGGTPRSLDELKELIKKAAEKDPDVNTDAREFTPHISCRKTYVRDV